MAAERKARTGRKEPVNWKKVGAIVIGVFFVVVMVVSTLGVGWITQMTKTESGDSVVVDYTMYAEDGRPVVTTNQRTVDDGAKKGLTIFLAEPMKLTAGASVSNQLIPLRVNHAVYGWLDYTLFSEELNALQKGVIGVKNGESVDIKVPSSYMLEREMTAREYAAMGGNLTGSHVGDQLILGFTDTSSDTTTNSTKPRSYVRVAYISKLSGENMTVNYGVKSINTNIRSIKSV